MKYNKQLPYIRVGVHYYKIVDKPLISGDTMEALAHWNKDTIKDDLGPKVIDKIPKYDGFCNIPCHMDYVEEVGGFINMYERLPSTPKKGSIENFKKFMFHIFQEQYELGLDYLSILYQHPTQILPVLCLVSKERGTGKTTFLNLLKAIFGKNMTYNKNEDFRSQFNSDWASKLIIAVDEVLLDRREDSERIKNLSTARTFKSEAKGKDRVEVEFFGKFILCSNNEDNFILIEPGEIRYWVIRLSPVKSDDVFLLEKLREEVPAIMHFLANRDIETANESRMWFHPSLIKTPALKKVIRMNRSKAEMELASILTDIMEDFNIDEIKFTLNDAIGLLNRTKIRHFDRVKVKEILQENWQLKPIENASTYTKYAISTDGTIYEVPNAKGRYYMLNQVKLNEKMLNC